MKRRNGYNPKRRIAPPDFLPEEERGNLSRRVTYGGNPEHKRSPGDYNLTPPAQPRPGKTLCDGNRQILKDEALDLLRNGLQKGMFCPFEHGSWPQNIWSISDTGEIFEAQIENPTLGTYHGYPVPADDDFRRTIRYEWERR
jgi:hypothetical protein